MENSNPNTFQFWISEFDKNIKAFKKASNGLLAIIEKMEDGRLKDITIAAYYEIIQSNCEKLYDSNLSIQAGNYKDTAITWRSVMEFERQTSSSDIVKAFNEFCNCADQCEVTACTIIRKFGSKISDKKKAKFATKFQEFVDIGVFYTFKFFYKNKKNRLLKGERQ